MTNSIFAVARRHINSPSREIAIAACDILSESPDTADIRAVRDARVMIYGLPDSEIITASGRTHRRGGFSNDLPHYAGLREGDMVHDTRGLPVVIIIAGAVFALMVLGAWAIWSDPVGRTAATVLQAEWEWK